jgi:hypothetical protein
MISQSSPLNMARLSLKLQSLLAYDGFFFFFFFPINCEYKELVHITGEGKGLFTSTGTFYIPVLEEL